MTRNILIATIFSLATAIMLGIIFIGESRRLPAADAAVTAERIERGARDYEQYCANCHGLAGQGGVNAGAPQLNNIVQRYMEPDAQGNVPFEQDNGIQDKYGTLRNYIEATLFSGIRGTAMPAFGATGTLRQDQIENITTYVLSWGGYEGTLPDAALRSANLEATRVAPTADPNANPLAQAELAFNGAGCNACHLMNDQRSAAGAPGLGGLFQPGGTAAFGELLPNGEPVNEENVLAWIHGGTLAFPENIESQDGQEYGVMPGFPNVTDEQYQQMLIWLRAHNRDGSLTEEAQQLQQQGQEGAPAPDPSVQPTGQPNQPTAPDSPAGPGSTATP